MYFLFSAGLSGDVLRQLQQCSRKHDVLVSEDSGVTLAQVRGEGCSGQNVYFLFSAGPPGDVLRQPQQCSRKHYVIVSEDSGVTLAQVRGGGFCKPKCVFFIQCRATWGRSAPTTIVKREARRHSG